MACAAKPPLDLGVIPSGVSVDAKVQYYDFSAASLGEMRAAMRQLGPTWEGTRWPAVTTSDLRWTFQVERLAGRCAIHGAHVQMRTTIVFPRWTPSVEPDSALMEWWRQMNRGLTEHEKGHALISLKTAGTIVHDLDALSRDCAEIATEANHVARQLMDSSRKEQQVYDASTRHGATQIQQAGRLRDP